jgi:hypothetical protein
VAEVVGAKLGPTTGTVTGVEVMGSMGGLITGF